MDVNLVLFKKDGSTKEIPLERKKNTIGRSHTCALKLPLMSVSKKHCRITCNSDTVTITDLHSLNGIKVNGEPVKEKKLNPGDLLKIGPVIFVLKIDGQPQEIKKPEEKKKEPKPKKKQPVHKEVPPEEDEIDFDNLDKLPDDDLNDLSDLDDEQLSDEKEAV